MGEMTWILWDIWKECSIPFTPISPAGKGPFFSPIAHSKSLNRYEWQHLLLLLAVVIFIIVTAISYYYYFIIIIIT